MTAFSGSSAFDVGAQVIHFDPAPPSQINPRVPDRVDRITMKALAKKPADRYQSADQMIGIFAPCARNSRLMVSLPGASDGDDVDFVC